MDYKSAILNPDIPRYFETGAIVESPSLEIVIKMKFYGKNGVEFIRTARITNNFVLFWFFSGPILNLHLQACLGKQIDRPQTKQPGPIPNQSA